MRYYWERYLEQNQKDIRGCGLEIGTTRTIRWYGGEAITRADAIDLTAHSAEITWVADLSRADNLPSDTYDCFVNQFTMHVIYDVEAALYHSIRILKPGGVLLANFSYLSHYLFKGLDMGTGSPLHTFWCFTPLQVENLLRRIGLTQGDYEINVYGNLFVQVACQMYMPAEELTRQELDYIDPFYPVLICVRVVKPGAWRAKRPEYRDPWVPEINPVKWNAKAGLYATLREADLVGHPEATSTRIGPLLRRFIRSVSPSAQ